MAHKIGIQTKMHSMPHVFVTERRAQLVTKLGLCVRRRASWGGPMDAIAETHRPLFSSTDISKKVLRARGIVNKLSAALWAFNLIHYGQNVAMGFPL